MGFRKRKKEVILIFGVFAVASLLSGCTVKMANGFTITILNVTVVNTVPAQLALTVAPLYPSAANWNYYYETAAYGVANSVTPGACTGLETAVPPPANPNPCVHGGEHRVVSVPLSSCTGLTMTDALNVFNWVCSASSGSVTFTSYLQQTKGLQDLLTTIPVPAFAPNSVTLYKNGTQIGSSSSTTWWSNPVHQVTNTVNNDDGATGANLPTDPATTLMGTAAATSTGTLNDIYVVTSNLNSTGWGFGASGLALVVMPGYTVYTIAASCTLGFNLGITPSANPNFTPSGNSCNMWGYEAAILDTNAQNFLWIEGNFDGNDAAVSTFNIFGDGFDIPGTNFSVFNKIGIQNSLTGEAYAMNFGGFGPSPTVGSNFNRISNVNLENNWLGIGLWGGSATGSNNNIFFNIRISNATGDNGINLSSGGGNIFSNVTISHSKYDGIYTSGNTYGQGNVFSRLTVMNATSMPSNAGIHINNEGNDIIQNSVIAGTTLGYYLNGGGACSNETIVNAATDNYQSLDIHLSGNANGDGTSGCASVTLMGTLLNNTSSECYNSWGAGSNIVDSTSPCQVTGPLASVVTTATSFGPSAFVGPITSIDPLNASDNSLGQGTYQMTDWLNFSNPYRVWGNIADGTSWPDGNDDSYCGGGTCQIWDWSLLHGSGDPLFNSSGGGGANTNGAFVAGAMCPAQVNGSVTSSLAAPSGGFYAQPFLTNAVELLNTGGNDNGLCETGETCLYTPNFGAYQGHGSLAQCNFVNGAVSNVTMYGYTQNGY